MNPSPLSFRRKTEAFSGRPFTETMPPFELRSEQMRADGGLSEVRVHVAWSGSEAWLGWVCCARELRRPRVFGSYLGLLVFGLIAPGVIGFNFSEFGF
ncbi:hypothetical protein GOBAR_DD16553 [Gossypium barbadense]|nr:hypothetical protein GOBAR_DD16553 [Gossypium barbadense]